mgnify:CR=1 FL=1
MAKTLKPPPQSLDALIGKLKEVSRLSKGLAQSIDDIDLDHMSNLTKRWADELNAIGK